MRIKSYFAASVQAAIAMARREFGEGVTLVTSHIASLDARQFGEYEVVFAIEEQVDPRAEAVPEALPELVAERVNEEPPVPSRFTEFQQVLLNVVQPKVLEPDGLASKLDDIRCALIDLGLEPLTTSAVMTLIEKSLPAGPMAPIGRSGNAGPERLDGRTTLDGPEKRAASVVTLPLRRHSHLSEAELSFISSVSGSPGTEVVQNR